jgi:hypothetical protein
MIQNRGQRYVRDFHCSYAATATEPIFRHGVRDTSFGNSSAIRGYVFKKLHSQCSGLV